MNNGIKNKLKTLIGEQVGILINADGISMSFPPDMGWYRYKVLRFEDEDCVVLGSDSNELLVPIDNISHIKTFL